MHRNRNTTGAPMPAPGPALLVGMMIGSAIMVMAGGAMAIGAGLALTQASVKGK
ncbi:MAG TPA: hypothetical protein VIG49_09305 [Acetobacteraceae bacterium]|jgi:hypothetical protein